MIKLPKQNKDTKKTEFIAPSKEDCLKLIKTAPLEWNKLKSEHFDWVPNLDNSGFENADLFEVDLRNCSLVKVNLSQTINLHEKSLGGSNLDSAKLPESFEFVGLNTVKELSLSSSTIFIAIVLFCFYCYLTIFSTNNISLLTNSGNSTLPILGFSLDIIGFYIAAPLILLAFYIYFQLNLKKLWFEFSQLPSFFPDGKSLDQKSYSWLINDLIISYVSQLENNNGFLLWLQNLLIKLLIWWLVPITIFGIWRSYLINHDVILSFYHSLILSICIMFGLMFRKNAIITLQGKTDKRSVKDDVILFASIIILTIIFTAAAYFRLSDFFYINKPSNESHIGLKFEDMAEIVKKPENWDEIERKLDLMPPMDAFEKADIETQRYIDRILGSIKIVNLRNKNLFGMEASNAFFVNADLSGANLENSQLVNSYFQHTKLEDTKFKNAGLSGVSFEGAYILGTNFEKAFLRAADFKNTDVCGDFKNAIADHTNFSHSKLTYSDFTDAQLDESDFSNANLELTVFKNASLMYANFKGAEFFDTDFSQANLDYAIGLTYEQMRDAIIDEDTVLPSYLLGYRKKLLKNSKNKQANN